MASSQIFKMCKRIKTEFNGYLELAESDNW